MKIKVGDKVQVTAGKDKGKVGAVTQVFEKRNKVVVEGVNVAIKHVKRQGDKPGQRVEFNAPLAISNVMIVGKDGTPGRVGFKMLDKDGTKKKVRFLKLKKGTEDLD
jgi:large subunit ribosomal protein L24